MTTATLEPKKKSRITLEPLNDRVVVVREEADDRTAGGIVLPDKVREKVNRGKVIAAGPGKLSKEGKRIPMTVKAGDRVLIGKYTGQDIKINDEEHTIVLEDEILFRDGTFQILLIGEHRFRVLEEHPRDGDRLYRSADRARQRPRQQDRYHQRDCGRQRQNLELAREKPEELSHEVSVGFIMEFIHLFRGIAGRTRASAVQGKALPTQ